MRPGSAVSTSGQGVKREREPVPKVETGQETTIENAANDIEPVVSISASAQEIKCAPVLKTETIPAPASPSPSEQEIKLEKTPREEEIKREASIPMETVMAINAPNLNRTFTVRRKVAKRTNPLYLAPPSPPQNIAAPLPQAEEIPARKEPRFEKPLLALRRSSRLRTCTPLSSDTVVASTRRQNYRRVIPTSSIETSTPPPPIATEAVPTLRRSRRQIQLPRIETSEEQLDNDDDDDASGDHVDLSCPSWEYRLSELADYRKIHGHCSVPTNYNDSTKLANWVANQRRNYRLHVKGKTSSMTLSRIQELESLGFEWGCKLYTPITIYRYE